MIIFRLPIRGDYDSITRPVSLGVLKDIKDTLYLNPVMRTKLYNQIEEFHTMYQTGPLGLTENAPKLEEIKFSVVEKTNTDTLITTPTNFIEYKPVLHDTDVNAYIKPIYVESTIEFSIKYKTRSRTNAGNFINMLRLSAAETNFVKFHNVEYTFYLPPEILELFLDISILKHNVIKDNSNYEDYLIKFSDGRLSIVGGLDGNVTNMNIVVKEKQRDVVGYFESDIVEVKEEYNSDENNWIADFTYTLKYNKPTAIVIGYPILIYNQLLPEKYIIMQDNLGDSGKMNYPTTYGNNWMSPFHNTNINKSETNKLNFKGKFLNIPNFDNFIPYVKIPYCTSVFSVLVAITEDDRRNLLNLKDLMDYMLNEDILNCLIAGEWKYITKRYKSLFYLSLYENDKLMPDGILEIDADLNVFATIDLDLTKTYRVVFNILTDLSAADKQILDRMKNCNKIFSLALEALSIKPGKEGIPLNKADKIALYRTKGSNGVPYTVMIGTILAYAKES